MSELENSCMATAAEAYVKCEKGSFIDYPPIQLPTGTGNVFDAEGLLIGKGYRTPSGTFNIVQPNPKYGEMRKRYEQLKKKQRVSHRQAVRSFIGNSKSV